jgi:uncharacterized pyridoxal phosphate-dependent enzyme
MPKLINARGPYTPLGVSRASTEVANSVAVALQSFYEIDALLSAFSEYASDMLGVQAATITHCSAASITLAVAAAMCRDAPALVEELPRIRKRHVAVIQSPHVVNYGHSILQAIALSGADAVVAGSSTGCSEAELEHALSQSDVTCLVLVDSRLCAMCDVPIDRSLTLARRYDVPTIIDAAAQDLRLAEVLSQNAELTLISAQKYLKGPTAGLVFGRADLVDEVNKQFKGIGRGMKPSKEAIVGAHAALASRASQQEAEWRAAQQVKLDIAIERLTAIKGILVQAKPDICGGPFSRVELLFSDALGALSAATLASELRAGDPSIHVDDTRARQNVLSLEFVLLELEEVLHICARIAHLVNFHSSAPTGTTTLEFSGE